VHEHGEEARALDPSDPFAIVSAFRAAVEIEDGMTPVQMLRALKPWSKALSQAGWLDFGQWLKAMERPFVREAGDDPERIACIEVYPVVNVHRMKVDGERRAEAFVSWETRGRFESPVESPSGRTVDCCSLSFVNPGLLGHLPMRIVRAAEVNDIRTCAPWREPAILLPSVKGVYDGLDCTPTFFDTVVLGFLDEISSHGSPEDTEDVREGIMDSVSDIENGKADIAHTHSGTSVMEALGILDDDDRAAIRRNEASGGLSRLLDGYRGDPSVMAQALGLTEFGLADLVRGDVSRYSAESLERFEGIARGLVGGAAQDC